MRENFVILANIIVIKQKGRSIKWRLHLKLSINTVQKLNLIQLLETYSSFILSGAREAPSVPCVGNLSAWRTQLGLFSSIYSYIVWSVTKYFLSYCGCDSQELLEVVERERKIRSNPPRHMAIFHHPTLGDFELQHVCSSPQLLETDLSNFGVHLFLFSAVASWCWCCCTWGANHPAPSSCCCNGEDPSSWQEGRAQRTTIQSESAPLIGILYPSSCQHSSYHRAWNSSCCYPHNTFYSHDSGWASTPKICSNRWNHVLFTFWT